MLLSRTNRWDARRLLIVGAAVLAAGMAQPPQKASPKTEYFTIETGSSTGPNFAIGSTLATVLSNPPGSARCEVRTACGPPGLIAVALTSAGTVANARDVALGKAESALIPANIAVAAYQGREPFKAEGPYKSLRAIARLYEESVQLVAAKGGKVKSVADLKGRTVAIDADGTVTNATAIAVLAAAGVPRKAVKLTNANPDQAADLLAAHKIDAFFLVATTPSDIVTHLAARAPIMIVPLGGAVLKKLDPSVYVPQRLAAGLYSGSATTETVSVGMLWVVNARIPNALIHDVTAALFDETNTSYFNGLSGSRTPADAVAGLPVPLHPGAEEFYRAHGALAAAPKRQAVPTPVN